MPKNLTLQLLWEEIGFKPNPNQEQAILHTKGPLYLPAGPGSGKTRVLLWRTLNLIVFHGIPPEEIYLSTFTEKAAFQLREGLRTLLSLVTNQTGQHFDLSKMYVGTVHSLCQKMISDRRFYPQRQRSKAPVLLDELSQYFFLYKRGQWAKLAEAVGFDADTLNIDINTTFRETSTSRHKAALNTISFFNRLSEECVKIDEIEWKANNPTVKTMLRMYQHYLNSLAEGGAPRTDFSLLQQKALDLIENFDGAERIFKHVIIDEYQDTNTVQERIFFRLAAGHKNLCVVGDDDQALYRFRGATVENFVEFPERCKKKFGAPPKEIPLNTNYRSRARIVKFYTDFIVRSDWAKRSGGAYRVTKDIQAASDDRGVSVIANDRLPPPHACAQIAQLVRSIVDQGKVENPNQIAFLYPSLKAASVPIMIAALEDVGLRAYAPRAGRFLEVDEATALFGVYLYIFGRPQRGNFGGREYADFHNWLDRADTVARELIRNDPQLKQYVEDRRAELETAAKDYIALLKVVERKQWDVNDLYQIDTMKRPLYEATGLSDRAQRNIANERFERAIKRRLADRAAGRRGQDPYTLRYFINSATSVDWSVLDLFYRVCGFDHFKAMLDLAESGEDEGPICNLGLISQYLARFMEEYRSIITADLLSEDGFQRLFFSAYLFALFRLGESEYEDAEDPFPRGRIPFLTVHQAKGLEFPVVIFGNPRKKANEPQIVETLVRPLLDRAGEPSDKQPVFDLMRLFYVALSRAKNLVVIMHLGGQGNYPSEPLKTMLDSALTRIPQFDVSSLPAATLKDDDLPRNYSYTSDYLLYQTCARQYMVFRKYDFVPSRSQTMMFGSLVHRTLDDLHQLLISQRNEP